MPARSGQAERSGALASGSVVAGKYSIARRVGEGGTAHVWAAEHLLTGRAVALKIMKEQAEDVRRRFLREARAACALRHPGVVEVLDALETDEGELAIVMELLDGAPLSARLKDGPLRLDETSNLIVPVLSAVGYAHELGIVHRDLKPDNIFLTRTGRTLVVDFGLAKDLSSNGASMVFTQHNEAVGTPAYMAPEQAFPSGPVDHRADIWSLGLILYEMLSGELPTLADSLGRVFQRIAAARFAPLDTKVVGLPPAVSGLVGRMLARERNLRLTEVAEAYDVLARYADPAIVQQYPRPMKARPTPGLVEAPPIEPILGSQSSTDAVTLRATPGRARSRGLFVGSLVVGATAVVSTVLAFQAVRDVPLLAPARAAQLVARARVAPPAIPSPSVMPAPSAASAGTAAPEETSGPRVTPSDAPRVAPARDRPPAARAPATATPTARPSGFW